MCISGDGDVMRWMDGDNQIKRGKRVVACISFWLVKRGGRIFTQPEKQSGLRERHTMVIIYSLFQRPRPPSHLMALYSGLLDHHFSTLQHDCSVAITVDN